MAIDWKNAKQTIFKGRQVIKIPLLNENRLPTQKPDGRKVDAIVSHTQSDALPSTYFDQHPPEVFFIKDNNDSIHSSLLNFIPDNQAIGFG